MARLIVLDISGMYAVIVDEIYCNKEQIASEKKRYSSSDYMVVGIIY